MALKEVERADADGCNVSECPRMIVDSKTL
jgi:hypothetical protein